MPHSKYQASSGNKKETQFLEAAASGNLEIVTKLLPKVDINVHNMSRKTALMLAVEASYRFKKFSQKRLDVIQFLIAQGADPDIICTSHFNQTALDMAVELCCPEVVRVLYPVTKKTNVRSYGFLPDPKSWHWDESTWLQTVSILKDFGVNFNELWSGEHFDKGLFSKFLCRKSSTEAAYNAMAFILSHIKAHELASCARELLGMLICHIKDKSAFKTYLSKFVTAGLINIDVRDSAGQTALHKATIKGHLAAVEVLVEFGANVNNPGRHNLTPLHFAAAGNVEITKFLLNSGANPKMLDDQNRDPIKYSQAECISEQECYKARYSDAQIAISAHQEKVSKALRGNGLFKANDEAATVELKVVEVDAMNLG